MMETILGVSLSALTYLSITNAQDPYGNVTNAIASYEVTPPLPDYGDACATKVIVDRLFANSYGHPAIISFEPPEECPDFTNVVADIYQAVSNYQYDRLMHLYKDGIEVWRPSTAEPVGVNVTCHEQKDLSKFANLFRTAGEMRFDLDNIVTSDNAGEYWTEVTLTFYKSKSVVNEDSWFYSPEAPATNFFPIIANTSLITNTPASGSLPLLPRNTTRAVLNVYASGNSNEEFWYTNSLSQDGPTRLVQVYINGTLAGFADPFPIIYTGGIDPGLWQPLLGLKASDVPSYTIDITPFLPQLWDEVSGPLPLQVSVGNGYGSPESIQSDWIIDTALLTWEVSLVTGTGSFAQVNVSKEGAPWNNDNTLQYGASYEWNVKNQASLNFTTVSGSAVSGTFTWSQNAHMVNENFQNPASENTTQLSQGTAQSIWDPAVVSGDIQGLSEYQSYSRSHEYPLQLLSQDSGYYDTIDREYDVQIGNNGQDFWLKQTQSSDFNTKSFDPGYSSINDVWEAGYHRHVVSQNRTIAQDTTTS